MPPISRRHRSTHRLLSTLAVGVLVMAGAIAGQQYANADATTVSVNNLRTGWDSNEAALSPASVSSSDFGQLFSATVDGQVYAQPIVGGHTLIVATENNNVYGLNPQTGAQIWTQNIGPAWPAATLNCGDLVPNIGITSSPVYDASTNTVYVLGKVNDGATVDSPNWRMHAFDVGTGAERAGWPVTIAGYPSNSPGIPFNAEHANQRPGLLLMGGVVYAGFASHCDHGPYVGYVAGVSTSTHLMTALWSTEAGSASGGSGIWQSGGGLVSDGAGRIFLATGNGTTAPAGSGKSAPGALGEAVVRLKVNTNGSLSTADYFSPANGTNLNTDDTDLGSGGPTAIPDGYGSTTHPHLLLQIGKDGRLFVLDRDNLGGTAQGTNGTDAVVSMSGPYGGVWGHPAFYGGSDGGYAYITQTYGQLLAFKISQDSSSTPVLVKTGNSTDNFGYTSGSPVVTSTGTSAGSGLVWVIRADSGAGTNGQLRAYDAVPINGVMKLRYSVSIGTAAKFATPATDGGRVYVGTRDGKVFGFGRPATSSLTGSPVDFGFVAVNTTARANLTLTATRNLTVTGASTTAPFATSYAGSTALTSGQSITIPVSFTPTTTGGQSTSVAITTDVGQVSFDLSGTGTKAGLAAQPSSIDYGTVPVGGAVTNTVSITNTGTQAASVTSTTAPTAPFSTADLPATGTSIPAGGSLALSVRFVPTAAGTFHSAITVTTADGSASVSLTGIGATGSSHLTLSPNPLAFGAVLLGTSSTKTFNVADDGNLNLTITKAKAPAGVFYSNYPFGEGTHIEAGEDVDQPVTFGPTTTGPVSSGYLLTGDDGQGVQTEGLNGVGARVDNFVLQAGGRCLDDQLSVTTDGNPIVSYDCNGTTAQNFRFGAANSLQVLGKCVDVTNSGVADGTLTQLYTCNGTAAQGWSVNAAGNLVNASSGKCLTPVATPAANRTRLAISTCTATGNQVWLSAARTGPIVGATSARCLDVPGSSIVDGTQIQLYDCNGTGAQSWTVARGGQITALGKCLDVKGSGRTSGTAVQLFSCNGTGAQQWSLSTGGVLTNPQSGLCLGGAAKGTALGTKLQILTCTGTADQTFVLN